MRQWHYNLKDCPRLSEAQLFGQLTAPGLEECLKFNAAYRSHLELELQFCPCGYTNRKEALSAANADNNRCWEIYSNLNGGVFGPFVSNRRAALRRLKELLGDEDYYAGQLPPHVPVWWFREVRR